MPDTGDFDPGLPERGGQAALPGDWGGAFAAMPLEAPDAHGWQRMQARLPASAPAPRARWPLWLASAASLALAVAVPMRIQQDAEAVAAASTGAFSPASIPKTAPASDRNRAPAPAVAIASVAAPQPARIDTPQPAPVVRQRAIPAHALPAPATRPIRTLAPSAAATRLAEAMPQSTVDAELEPLYAQSAQLEDLLAMARDDRVATGTLAAVTDDLDARIASIDAALVQPDVSRQRRTELWGERVDTLRQLVGVEATQRLLAARGQQYDAALVSID